VRFHFSSKRSMLLGKISALWKKAILTPIRSQEEKQERIRRAVMTTRNREMEIFKGRAVAIAQMSTLFQARD